MFFKLKGCDIYHRKEFLLQEILKDFIDKTGFIPHFGVELEFYVVKDGFLKISQEEFQVFFEKLQEKFREDNLIYEIEKEKGENQIEIKFLFDSNLENLCEKIDFAKKSITELADKNSFKAEFSGQIFDDDCGNAMQFNISLHDSSCQNLFKNNQNLLENAIAGILKFANEMVFLSAKNQDDFKRFGVDLNRNLFKNGKYTAPINISCGIDNRTCLVRYFKNNKKNYIEYRMACANCEQFMMICALLFAMKFGIENDLKIVKSQRIFGNAFDEKYDLEEFVKNLNFAQKLFLEGEIFEYFSKLTKN